MVISRRDFFDGAKCFLIIELFVLTSVSVTVPIVIDCYVFEQLGQ